MTKPACKTCCFYHPISDPIGECRRYPAFIDRYPIHWCGEYKPKTPIVTENLT